MTETERTGLVVVVVVTVVLALTVEGCNGCIGLNASVAHCLGRSRA